MGDLTLQVGQLNDVIVDDGECPNPGGCQVQGDGGSEPAGSDNGHASHAQALLPFLADLGEP